MASSIHYKFRSTLEYKNLQFDGLHISGADLVRDICAKENIKIEFFNLLLQNAHTRKEYKDTELIPRNSSIIVQRVPRTEAAKVQKVQSGVNSGMITQDGSSTSTDPGTQLTNAQYENMDEAERLSHVKDVSTRAYDPSNFRKKTGGIMSGPPPPTYTCNRCYQAGHWYKNCPMLNTKRTTGIPSQELMETTDDDPLAMLHPSGKYVVPIMHWKARQEQNRKAEEGSSSPAQQDRKVPTELQCPICHHLIKEAVVTSCCGNSYCADCIGQKILENDANKCPGVDCDKFLTVDALIPNKSLREAAEAWLNQANLRRGTGTEQHSEQIRIRIGLQPKPVATPAAAVLASGISPGSVVVQPQSVPTSEPISQVTISQPTIVTTATVTSTASIQPVTSQTINIPLDTSLPPPMMRLPEPSVPIPGVTNVNSIQSYQLPPGIGALPIQPHQPQIINPYAMPNIFPSLSNHGHAGFVPTSQASSQGLDLWEAFLKKKDNEHSRWDNIRRLDKDRERRRRSAERDSRRRRKESSSSTDSSDSSTDDDRRRKRSKKTRVESSKRRTERDSRLSSKRDYERSRRDRDRDSKSTRSIKESTRDRKSDRKSVEKEDSRRKKREEHDTKKKNEERNDGKISKERKEDDDEAAIDGALAEYEKLKESASEIAVDTEQPKSEVKEEVKEEERDDEKHEESVEGSELNDSETSERNASPEFGEEEEQPQDNKHQIEENVDRIETSEVESREVLENEKDEQLVVVAAGTEESDLTADERDSGKAKETQSSTANSDDDEDNGESKKNKKKDKKHKKHKKTKKHKKRDDDDDNEDSDKKRKRSKKHKKEKKAKKERRETDEDLDEEKKKLKRKERKRSRGVDSDSDAPRTKSRRSEERDERHDNSKSSKRDEKTGRRDEKDNKSRSEKHRETRRHDRDDEERPKSSKNDKEPEEPPKPKPVTFSIAPKAKTLTETSSKLQTEMLKDMEKKKERKETSERRSEKKESSSRSHERRKKEETDVESVEKAKPSDAKKKHSKTEAAFTSSASPDLAVAKKIKNTKITFKL